MRRVLLAFLFAMVASPAIAALAPEYYQRARDEAASVVVISVERVRGLHFTRGNGACAVEGEVAAVERGDAYQIGQKVTITVPCRRRNAENIATGVVFQEFDALRASERGRAWLDAEGELALHQYEIID